MTKLDALLTTLSALIVIAYLEELFLYVETIERPSFI